jgi:hypothetical protein
MPAPNIIQLRQLLAERFPGLRTRAEELTALPRLVWSSGLPQLDGPLRGGLPRGVLTEVVAERRGAGSALLMAALIQRAMEENKLVAVVDGQDSLDVTQIRGDLSRLLWVRCRAAAEAMKAADLLLRDANVPLVLLDLACNPAAQLRKIPATTWYRFQRIVEMASTVCVVLAPRPMVSPAQARIVLNSRFSLDALERDAGDLLGELRMEVSEARRAGEMLEAVSGSA